MKMKPISDDESDEDPLPSTNRIVRMPTHPPPSQKRPPEMKGPKDCEESEIVDKKAASKKRANIKRKKSTSDEIQGAKRMTVNFCALQVLEARGK
jgi:hypothetical protein